MTPPKSASANAPIKVGILGASGFAGAELLRLLAGHPGFEVAVAAADSQAGTPIGSLYPSLAAAYAGQVFDPSDLSALNGIDLVFLAMSHGQSQKVMGELLDIVPKVVDLAADFRLADASLYPTWYGEEHSSPQYLSKFVYGLPEFYRSSLEGATHVAVPGCYPTCASLTLAPLVAHGVVDESSLIVNAVSGVSGAGRAPTETTTFCKVDEDFTAYGVASHRHTPEIEMILQKVSGSPMAVTFTPHLAPMNRGMLTTCYGKFSGKQFSTEELMSLYKEFYADEQFVVVIDGIPATKSCAGSNSAHVSVRVDTRTNTVIAMGAIDNLGKGAAGQALQCANIITGQSEELGLSTIGLYP